MNKLSDIYALFDQYINNEMSESEKVEFQQKLTVDEDFKNEFDQYQDIIIGIKAASEEQLRAEFKEIDKSLNDPIGHTAGFYVYRIAAILVILLIGVGLILIIKYQQPKDELLSNSPEELIDEIQKEINKDSIDKEKKVINTPEDDRSDLLLAMNLYNEYFSTYPNNLLPQSRGGIPTDSLELAMYYYQLADFKICLGILDNLLLSNSINNDLLFYAAMCHMNNLEFEKALLNFDKISKSADSLYIHDVKWYKALIYLRTKRLNQAIEIFNQLVSYNNIYKKKSMDIINSLSL